MRRAPSGRPARWTPAVIVLVSLLASAWLAPAAHAHNPRSWAAIAISSLSPAIPKPGDTITITGTVTNTSTEQLGRVQATMWRNQAPILDAEQMAVTLASDANDPLGSRMDAGYQQLTRSDDPATSKLPVALTAGESMPFTVRAKLDQFSFPSTAGIYLVGVQIRGTLNGLSGTEQMTLGRARTFLPVGVAGQTFTSPSQTCSLVVLSTIPSLLTSPSQPTTGGGPVLGVFRDDSLLTQVSAGGQLRKLLALSRRSGYSVLVDPELVASVRSLAAGYQIREHDGTLTSQPASEAAQRWLDDLAHTPKDRLFQLPYALPDVAALAHDGQQALYQPDLGADILPGVPRIALPAGGLADDQTLALAGTGTLRAILLSTESTGASAAKLSAPPTIGGRAPVLNFDASALDGGPGPFPYTTPSQIRQRFLADSYLAATTQGSTVVRLVTTSQQAAALPSIQAPWLRQVSLQKVLDQHPTKWKGLLSYPEAGRKDELPPATVDRTAALAEDLHTYGQLVPDAGTGGSSPLTVARASSMHWRGHTGALDDYLAPQRSVLDKALHGNGVTIGRPGTVLITGSGTTVRSPIVVYNNLDRDVTVNVSFTSDNASRLEVQNLPGKLIPAHSKKSLEMTYIPRANGDVPVTAQLETTSGTTIGRPISFIVKVTNLGMVGWVIATAAAIVLFVSTFLRIRQVRRETGSAAPPGSDRTIDTRGPQPPPPTEKVTTVG